MAGVVDNVAHAAEVATHALGPTASALHEVAQAGVLSHVADAVSDALDVAHSAVEGSPLAPALGLLRTICKACKETAVNRDNCEVVLARCTRLLPLLQEASRAVADGGSPVAVSAARDTGEQLRVVLGKVLELVRGYTSRGQVMAAVSASSLQQEYASLDGQVAGLVRDLQLALGVATHQAVVGGSWTRVVKARVTTEWPLSSTPAPAYHRISVHVSGTSEAALWQLRQELLAQVRRSTAAGGTTSDGSDVVSVLEAGHVRMVVDEDGDRVDDLTLLRDMDRVTLVMMVAATASAPSGQP